MPEFRMPSLGADMESGTVVEWLVAPGDRVHRGDVVAVVDTDKAAIDVECFDDGVVDRLLVPTGTRVAVGTPLALIGSATPDAAPHSGEPLPPPFPPPGPVPPPVPPPPVPRAPAPGPPGPLPPPEPVPPVPPEAAPATEAPLVHSPLARKRAAEAGIDLATVRGSGPGGAITRADVDQAIAHLTSRGPRGTAERRTGGRADAAPPVAPARPRTSPYARRLAAERGIDLTALTASGAGGVVRARDVPQAATPGPPRPGEAMRRATAALMTRANREIPHYYLALDIDLGPALGWLREHNLTVPVADRVLPAAVLLRAVVLAAQTVPQLNGHWVDDRLVPGDGVHLGVAVSLREGGLVVPVVHHAETLGVDALMARTRESAERARSGRLRSSEAGGATTTVTNLGELGVDSVDGVIHPPQVALVGFGTIRRRAWADGESVVGRPVVTATLAADHRASDGAVGARLLREIDHRLHRPEEL